MKKRNVEELSGCTYVEINDDGLVIERKKKRETLSVDTVVICAGQEPLRSLYESLVKRCVTGIWYRMLVYSYGLYFGLRLSLVEESRRSS